LSKANVEMFFQIHDVTISIYPKSMLQNATPPKVRTLANIDFTQISTNETPNKGIFNHLSLGLKAYVNAGYISFDAVSTTRDIER
jgi:hypothetical protein